MVQSGICGNRECPPIARRHGIDLCFEELRHIVFCTLRSLRLQPFASVGFLVCFDVLSEVVATAESLGATSALVRFLLSMRSHVSFEMFKALEQTATREERAAKTLVCD